MPDILTQKDIASLLSPGPFVVPQSSAAATINSAVFDRVSSYVPGTAYLQGFTGVATGAPTAISVTHTVQDSADGVSFAAYIDPNTTVAAALTITSASSQAHLGVDLTLARRFLRVQTVVSFTGGTSPAILTTADLLLSGRFHNPGGTTE